ncbi:MAG: phytoene desaturase family protein [Balneolaceae bacterium]
MKDVIVIGAGIGGLTSAILLAQKGYHVRVFEKNSTPGGKMQERVVDGYRFDTGPSLLTMPFLLEKVFQTCGEDFDDYLQTKEIEPLCRYFYPDHQIFDNYSDRRKSKEQIKHFAPSDVNAYDKFLNQAEKLYNRTSEAFLFNPLYEISDLRKLNVMDFFRIDAFSTVSDRVNRTFKSSYLRKFFKRFTTYNGSSPFLAPATLNVIPHVEISMGGYYVDGGLYQIAKSLEKLALKMGIQFYYNSQVDRIELQADRITGIVLSDGEKHSCELLFANTDATDTLLNLLPQHALPEKRRAKQKKVEPSCSGFVIMLGCNKRWDQLRHHNIFFSTDYKKEFADIFESKKLPDDPTIYIANTSFSNPDHAPDGGSNLFVLINAPSIDSYQNWPNLKQFYTTFIIKELEKRGLEGLDNSIESIEIITPIDFFEKYRSNRGSIYGTASNSRISAFLRPRNKEKSLQNLYLVGGSTHPGGGIPLVIQSAFNAVDLLLRNK